MFKNIFAIIPVIIFVSAAVAQNQTPVSDEWSRYKVWAHEFSFEFPRSPVKNVDKSQECYGRRKITYTIYKDGVVYILNHTHKVSPLPMCETKKDFSPEDFTAWLQNFQGSKKEKAVEKIKGVEAAQYRSDKQLARVYNDPKNDRWFELAVAGKFENKAEINKFLDSFQLGNNVAGTEIGDGWSNVLPTKSVVAVSKETIISTTPNKEVSAAPVTSGGIGGAPRGGGSSPGPGISGSPSDTSASKDLASGVKIFTMPKPPYTEEARKEQVEGSVMLRVMFNRDGTIGSVTVVKALGFGLTEQAIAASKRIVFTPAEREGVTYTVSKPVQYTFSLY